MKPNWIKIAGVTLTLISTGASLALDFLGKKEIDAKVAKAVEKALAKK